MRLFEFEEVPPIKLAAREYAAQGFKVIARGASALVLGDGNSIIKIGPTSDCWLNFAKAAQHASNPHLPKIQDIEIHGKHYLAHIEKLKDTGERFMKSPIYKKIVAWMVVNAKWKTPRDIYLGMYTPGQILKLSNMLVAEEPQIVEALKLVMHSKGGCNFDLHPDNVMLRGNTVVISDPLTHQG